ncbi:MAG: restriction endonuclease [Opitutaceae bacterium]|jgi:restriction system protein
MPIPNLDDIRRPALELLAEKNEFMRIRDVFQMLAPRFHLTDEDLTRMLPSGTQLVWHNRVNWACYDLYRAGALDRPSKGQYRINDYGRNLLKDAPARLTRTYLGKVSSNFASFIEPSVTPGPRAEIGQVVEDENQPDTTPEETIDAAVQKLSSTLRAELLEQLHKVDPFRFEQVVLDLLVAMGYGGSRDEAARRTKASNDEGIDGVINEDRLGLDSIYVQAKRWQGPVGRPAIQGFVGALAGAKASKGVFITTSTFSQTAVDYAEGVSHRVILIDGYRLADLMIEHGIGVSTLRTIAIKRLDSDYFASE